MKIEKIMFAIIALISLVAIFYSFTYLEKENLLIAPLNKQHITTRTPEFKWSSTGYSILIISNDKDFKIPLKEIKTYQNSYKLAKDLPLGTYYWKVLNNQESQINEFTIDSVVGLDSVNNTIKNTGNVQENITIKENSITGNIILDIGKLFTAKTNNTLFLAEQNED